jgi:hypothetical protein
MDTSLLSMFGSFFKMEEKALPQSIKKKIAQLINKKPCEKPL